MLDAVIFYSRCSINAYFLPLHIIYAIQLKQTVFFGREKEESPCELMLLIMKEMNVCMHGGIKGKEGMVCGHSHCKHYKVHTVITPR